jgi:hypothetical protein
MAGHLLFNSGSNESSLAPQFKWLDNTFNSVNTKLSNNFKDKKLYKLLPIFKYGSPMATMKTFIVLLESTLFTSWKTCLSRKKDIF